MLSVPLALLLASGVAAASEFERSYRFDIEAGSLSRALRSYGRTSGQQIIYTEALVEGRTRPALKGEFTSAAALDRLLEGTGLTAERAPSGAVMIRAKPTKLDGNTRSELLPMALPDPGSGGDAGQAPVRLASTEGSSSPRDAAREAGAAASGALSEARPALDEVLVTATKRASDVRDVPISIAVVSGQALSQLSIDNLEEMSSYIPNLTIADTSITTNVYMRGIGSGLDRGFEQSVGLFVDGIYMGRSKQYRAPMFDIDRVEVLRGPQPVLFGKNTTAGAIKIETRKPTPGEHVSADVSAEYENKFNGWQMSGVISGSPTESTGLRVAALYSETDGFARNTFRNVDEPGIEQWVARVTGVWEPSDAFSITAKYEHADFKYDGQLGEPTKIGLLPSGSPLLDLVANRVLFGARGASGVDPTLEGRADFRTHSDAVLSPQRADQSADNVAVVLDVPVGNLKLTGVLGYSEYVYKLANDVDFLPVPFTEQNVREKFDQESVEIRLASDWGGTFEFLTGVYWQKNNLSMRGQTAVNWEYLGPLANLPTGPAPINSLISGVDYALDTESLSAFGQVTWRFAPSLRLNIGARYGGEKKKNDRTGFCTRLDGAAFDPANGSDLLARNSGFCPRLPLFSGKRDEDHFMPSVQFQWNVTRNVMAYAKWDKSYKSGGFNAGIFATAADINYDEEKVSGYEVGLKSKFADGAAILNIALFDAKFKDLQVNTLTGAGQTLLSNAGAATTKGVELDGAWAVNRIFKVGGSASFLDADYDDYARGPCSAVQRSAAVGTGVPCVQNLTGRTTSYAPRWSGDFFGEAEFPLSTGLRLRLHADASYTDDYFYSTDLDPNLHQSSVWKFGARITLAEATGRWDVSLLGKNLTNKAVVVWGTGVPLVLGTYVGFTELPRTIALQANYHFRAR